MKKIFQLIKYRPLVLITFVMAMFFTLKCVSTAVTDIFSFDGAFNSQVSVNLAENGRYATSYKINELDTNEFSNKVTTGLPVTFPVALIFRIFGAKFANGLIVSSLYMILLMLASVYMLKKNFKLDDFFPLLFILLLWSTPSIFEYGMGLYGEIPTVFYFVVSIILFMRYSTNGKKMELFYSGFVFGISFITKTVILIGVPAISIATIWNLLLPTKNKGMKSLIKECMLFPAGAIIPAAGFEIYKLFSVGWKRYVELSSDLFNKTLCQAGVRHGFSDTPGIINKFILHLRLLPFTPLTCGAATLIILGALVVFIAILLWTQRKNESIERGSFAGFLIISITAVSYYGWWLLIAPTQKAWYRRLIDGTILLELAIVIAFSFAIKFLKKKIAASSGKVRFTNVAERWLKIFTLLIATVFFLYSHSYFITFEDTSAKKNVLAASVFIRKMPQDSQFFGYDWWQSPEASFISQKSFKNILLDPEMNTAGEKRNKFLVVGPFAAIFDKVELKEILKNYKYSMAFSNPDYKIYKLTEKRWSPLFSDIEKRVVDYHVINFSLPETFYYVRNVYTGEPGSGKWAQMDSGYLFKYDGEKQARLSLYFPKLKSYDKRKINLQFFVNGEKMISYNVEHDGGQEVIIPLKGIGVKTLELEMVCNAKVVSDKDVRELAVVVSKIELE